MVAVLANMLVSALGGVCEQAIEDQPVASGTQRADLHPPVESGAGAGQHRVHRPAVRSGRGGGGAGLGPRPGAGHRRRPGPLGSLYTQSRDGYRDLVAQVCLGEVGAIFGLEISRLARSTADLARLVALARLTDTPAIDGDGAYAL